MSDCINGLADDCYVCFMFVCEYMSDVLLCCVVLFGVVLCCVCTQTI